MASLSYRRGLWDVDEEWVQHVGKEYTGLRAGPGELGFKACRGIEGWDIGVKMSTVNKGGRVG